MDAIKSTMAENLGGVAPKLAAKDDQFDINKDVPDLSGKVALITGGSEGIGFATAYTLLRANLVKVFIVSMSEEVKDGAVEEVGGKQDFEYSSKIVWFQCDISDLPAVTDVAKKARDQTDRLDILCLNAGRGIMTYQVTDYNVTETWTGTWPTNSTVRIQIQASNAHQAAPKDVDFASLDELNTNLGPNGQYGRSKLANILDARYLDAHLHQAHPSILINATHPGFVETKMSTDDIHEPYPNAGYGMSVGMKPLKKDIWMGCVSTVFAATSTSKSGQYICPPAIEELGSELAQDRELGERLMKLTRDIVREKVGLQSVDKGCPLTDY